MLGDSLRIGMTMESSGVIERDNRGIIYRDGAPLRSPFACARLAGRPGGVAAAARVRVPGPHPEPLRRQGPPRGGPAHPRQPDAQLGADWRRLAAAAPRPECPARPDRLVLPHRRCRPSPISIASFALTAACLAAITFRLTRSRAGAIAGGGALRGQSRHPVSAEHADDRAAALRALDARGAAPRRLGAGRQPSTCRARPDGPSWPPR